MKPHVRLSTNRSCCRLSYLYPRNNILLSASMYNARDTYRKYNKVNSLRQRVYTREHISLPLCTVIYGAPSYSIKDNGIERERRSRQGLILQCNNSKVRKLLELFILVACILSMLRFLNYWSVYCNCLFEIKAFSWEHFSM